MKILAITTALLLAALAPAAAQPASAESPMSRVRSWGYQLQKATPAEIAASPFDLVVIDYSRNGTDAGRFTPAELKAMQKKPDGSRRLVIAYLSIGEAEDYRYYWDKRWVEPAPFKIDAAPGAAAVPAPTASIKTVRIPRLTAPGWLGRENTTWSGNFLVRYWYDGWQDLIMHDDKSYLARIQEAGFDGVYLDRVDVYYSLEADRGNAARRMADFVIELAKVARKRKPGFLIVPQNAEELLQEADYVAAIDAIAKEDLLFGGTGDGTPNPPGRIQFSSDRLQKAIAAKRPVLVVEYLDKRELIESADAVLRARGMIPYYGPRKLDRLVVTPPVAPRPDAPRQ